MNLRDRARSFQRAHDTDKVYTLSVSREKEGTMSKEAVFTIKLEPDLRTEFMTEAAGEDRPASQVMRELMRGYIAQRRRDREYDDYLQHKVEAARASKRANRGRSNDEVESTFSARRHQIAAKQA
jgi:hypothetical protein